MESRGDSMPHAQAAGGLLSHGIAFHPQYTLGNPLKTAIRRLQGLCAGVGLGFRGRDVPMQSLQALAAQRSHLHQQPPQPQQQCNRQPRGAGPQQWQLQGGSSGPGRRPAPAATGCAPALLPAPVLERGCAAASLSRDKLSKQQQDYLCNYGAALRALQQVWLPAAPPRSPCSCTIGLLARHPVGPPAQPLAKGMRADHAVAPFSMPSPQDLPVLLERQPCLDIFCEGVVFQDHLSPRLGLPPSSCSGKEAYRRLLWSLRFHRALFFCKSRVRGSGWRAAWRCARALCRLPLPPQRPPAPLPARPPHALHAPRAAGGAAAPVGAGARGGVRAVVGTCLPPPAGRPGHHRVGGAQPGRHVRWAPLPAAGGPAGCGWAAGWGARAALPDPRRRRWVRACLARLPPSPSHPPPPATRLQSSTSTTAGAS